MAEVETWADTAGGNGLGNPPDWPKENMDKSEVNDTMREMMGAIRRLIDALTWIDLFNQTDETWTLSKLSDTELRLSGPRDASAYFIQDRRIKITDGVTPVEGFVDSVSYGSGLTDVTVTLDGAGVVPPAPTQCWLLAIALGRAATANVGSSAGEVVGVDDFDTVAAASTFLGSAAEKDVAGAFGEAGKVPLYDQLGTVGSYNQGTGAGEIPTNADIPAQVIPAYSFTELASDFTEAGSGARNDVPGLSNIAVPGTPDGAKRYRIIAVAWVVTAAAYVSPNLPQLHMGNTGNETDAVIYDCAWQGELASSDDGPFLMIAVVQPASGNKISMSMDFDFGNFTIKGGDSTKQSFVEIQEILT